MEPGASNRKRFFHGTYQVTVDGQRRVALPKTWRLPTDDENTQFFLLPGRNHRIFIITEERANRLFDSADRLSVLDGEGIDACEDLASRMQIVTLDKQGRFALEKNLAEHAGITGKAVFLGAIVCGTLVSSEYHQEMNKPKEMSLDHLQRIEERAARQASNTGGMI